MEVQGETKGFIEAVLAAHGGRFASLLENAAGLRFQVLLSEVRHDGRGTPCLARHTFRADAEYFYPASAIKLCAAIAALQKVRQLRERMPGAAILPSSTLAFCPLFPKDKLEDGDPSNLNGGAITIVHEIRKLFLISDNQAFNRLYGYVGQRSLNEAMWEVGLSSTCLRHRLSEFMAPEDNRMCGAILCNQDSDAPLCLAPKKSCLVIPASKSPGMQIGSAYINTEGQRVEGPMDFSQKNAMSMWDLQDLLVKLMHSDIDLGSPGLQLEEGSRLLIQDAMLQYPAQSRNPAYAAKDYPDDYCKFFLPGLCRVRPKGALRIYNKIGQAFGFTIDNSYVLDIETGRDFFLCMAMYTNTNAVLNDDKYEYDTAYNVAADVAEVLCRALWQVAPVALRATCLDSIPSSCWAEAVQDEDPSAVLARTEDGTNWMDGGDLDTAAEDTSWNLLGTSAPSHGGECEVEELHGLPLSADYATLKTTFTRIGDSCSGGGEHDQASIAPVQDHDGPAVSGHAYTATLGSLEDVCCRDMQSSAAIDVAGSKISSETALDVPVQVEESSGPTEGLVPRDPLPWHRYFVDE